ncbi:MAG: hypothetical protein M1834_005911 [Cirrosporium novae-zelandiae]|nr:MAG: hypothetical protein M1834_005911 [Cirrosporium novae-zelandiae]
MAKVPADIAAAEVAGRIPDSVSLSYLAQSNDKPAIIAIYFIGALTLLIVILRCYARLLLIKKFGFDDALAVFTMTIYVSFIALCIVLIHLGSGRHIEYIQYVLSLADVKRTEVFDFAAHILYTTALFVCRLSGLAFYRRLTRRHEKFQLIIKLTFGFLIAAFLPQIFLLIFHCSPVTGLWPYSWQSGADNYTCLSWGLVYSVNSALSLICDLVMFIIPAYLITRLRVDQRHKIQLSFVLFPGILVIIISCVRIHLVVVGQWATDGSWAYNAMLGIENAEIAGTAIALSVPALKPLFGSWFSHLGVYQSGSASKSLSTNNKGKPRGSRIKLSTMRSQMLSTQRNDYEMAISEISVSVSAHPTDLRFKMNGSNEDLLESQQQTGLGKDGLPRKQAQIHITDEVSIVRNDVKL